MSKYDDTKITIVDDCVLLIVMCVVISVATYATRPKENHDPVMPPNYNLLCKKNFDMPSKFNVVLECMHIRTEGN